MLWLAMLRPLAAQNPTPPSDAEGEKPEAAAASGQQVTLHVKMFDVSPDKLRAVHWEIDTSVIVGLVAKSEKPAAGRSSFAVATVDEGKRRELWKKLEAVEALKVLSEPLLVTVSGRPAWMSSGGEVPVLVRNPTGTASIEYKKIGVTLELLPTCLDGQRLRLQINSTVSSLDKTKIRST